LRGETVGEPIALKPIEFAALLILIGVAVARELRTIWNTLVLLLRCYQKRQPYKRLPFF